MSAAVANPSTNLTQPQSFSLCVQKGNMSGRTVTPVSINQGSCNSTSKFRKVVIVAETTLASIGAICLAMFTAHVLTAKGSIFQTEYFDPALLT